MKTLGAKEKYQVCFIYYFPILHGFLLDFLRYGEQFGNNYLSRNLSTSFNSSSS